MHATITPLAKIVSQELTEKFENADIAERSTGYSLRTLRGRARAFQSLVGGGMERYQGQLQLGPV